MMETGEFPRLYGEFAQWFHLLTAPSEYAEEAAVYYRTILSACLFKPETLLELGSGGGKSASHLKIFFHMTLVDISPDMLEISSRLNPECEHLQGDMRTLRLDRQFAAVLVHDAIMYMTSKEELSQAISTAFFHCRPGGAALFTPDWTRETFQPVASQGGYDDQERGLRYLEWNFDPDSTDTRYVSHMVYLLRKGADDLQCIYDRHDLGLFSQQDWMRIIENAGFLARSVPFKLSDLESGLMFLGIKPSIAV
jgi:SAM-dependent methyltransferase